MVLLNVGSFYLRCCWHRFPPAHAELQIEINRGVENPTPIAVVPFAWQGRRLAT